MKTIGMPILVKSLIFVLFVFTFLLSSLIGINSSQAANETISAPSSVAGEANTAIAIENLTINGTGNDVIPVRLYVSEGSLSMSTTTGLTFTGPSSGASLEFSGTRTNINNALATLTYTRASVGSDVLEISLTEPGEIVFEDTGHLYEVVFAEDQNWTQARDAAAARTSYGSTGYLATVTSANENQFIADRLTQPGWMGASDVTTEGDWKWVTGPENGTSFWSGAGAGTTVGGQYANWNPGEPNNSSNEDCGQLLTGGSGRWNDLNCSTSLLDYYVVEYGAPGDLPEIETASIAINTALAPATPSAPTAVAGIESAQVSFSAPASNGSSITGYTVTSSPEGITATGATSPITVTGLTGGESYTFTVVATNGIGDSNASNASNSVIPTTPAVWDDDLLAMPRAGVPYSDGVTAVGYPTDLTYALTSGTLPPGLTLDVDSGEVSGTPTTEGTYIFELSATNGVGSAVTESFELEVASAPAIDLKLEFEVGSNIKSDLSVLVSGTGLEEGSEYTVVIQSTPRTIASGTVGSNNSFVVRAYLPRDLEPGSHSITVYGTSLTGAPLSDTAYFRVNNAGKIIAVSNSAAIGDELPLTGSQIFVLVFASLTLIVGGFVLVFRRKILSLRLQG